MEIKNRKPTRLKDYNYSLRGLYFVTVCVKRQKEILSEIVGSGDLDAPKVRLLPYGETVYNNITVMNEIYNNIKAEKFVIMPNHIHLLIRIINDDCGTAGSPFPTSSNLSRYISAFKRYTNREFGQNIWQRSFYDHIIRDENDYIEHLKYIENNPQKWLLGKDKYYV